MIGPGEEADAYRRFAKGVDQSAAAVRAIAENMEKTRQLLLALMAAKGVLCRGEVLANAAWFSARPGERDGVTLALIADAEESAQSALAHLRRARQVITGELLVRFSPELAAAAEAPGAPEMRVCPKHGAYDLADGFCDGCNADVEDAEQTGDLFPPKAEGA